MTHSTHPVKRSNTMASRVPHKMRHSIGACDAASIPQPAEETLLYTHPSVKIVKFELHQSAAPASSGPILPDLDYPVDAIEMLPWKVSTERIAALGTLRLENIASTTFLKASSSVIQPLLKNCQGWCVDGKSVFVLRIRKLTYNRIELPYETDDDKQYVESFKEVLSKVIRYEITPCPFKRGFSVELPEEAKTPRRKKAWTPKHSPRVNLKKLNFGEQDADGGERDTSDGGSVAEQSDESASQASGTSIFPDVSTGNQRLSSPSLHVRSPSRTVTEPLKPFSSLVSQFQEDSRPVSEVDDASLASSVDSFHSFLDPSSPSLPSPPSQTPPSPSLTRYYTADELHIPSYRGHQRDDSEVTVTAVPDTATEPQILSPDTAHAPDLSLPRSPQPHNDRSSETHGLVTQAVQVEDPNSTVRRRLRASRRRELSPLPPSSTLFSPTPRSPASDMSRAILRKTCSFVLGPPIQILLLLLRAAAKFAARQNKAEYACKTDDWEDDDCLTEDDFGMPLTSGPLPKNHDDTSPDPQPPGGWHD